MNCKRRPKFLLVDARHDPSVQYIVFIPGTTEQLSIIVVITFHIKLDWKIIESMMQDGTSTQTWVDVIFR